MDLYFSCSHKRSATPCTTPRIEHMCTGLFLRPFNPLNNHCSTSRYLSLDHVACLPVEIAHPLLPACSWHSLCNPLSLRCSFDLCRLRAHYLHALCSQCHLDYPFYPSPRHLYCDLGRLYSSFLCLLARSSLDHVVSNRSSPRCWPAEDRLHAAFGPLL